MHMWIQQFSHRQSLPTFLCIKQWGVDTHLYCVKSFMLTKVTTVQDVLDQIEHSIYSTMQTIQNQMGQHFYWQSFRHVKSNNAPILPIAHGLVGLLGHLL